MAGRMRAGLVGLAGRSWPAGRSLEPPGIRRRNSQQNCMLNPTLVVQHI
jgi:hypothetical protein